jgi:hypothetical protein
MKRRIFRINLFIKKGIYNNDEEKFWRFTKYSLMIKIKKLNSMQIIYLTNNLKVKKSCYILV